MLLISLITPQTDPKTSALSHTLPQTRKRHTKEPNHRSLHPYSSFQVASTFSELFDLNDNDEMHQQHIDLFDISQHGTPFPAAEDSLNMNLMALQYNDYSQSDDMSR
jgi:hypothetical protein